jgi:hypothetical protein
LVVAERLGCRLGRRRRWLRHRSRIRRRVRPRVGVQGGAALLAQQRTAQRVELHGVAHGGVARVVEAELGGGARAPYPLGLAVGDVGGVRALRDDPGDGELLLGRLLLAATAVGDRRREHDQGGGARLLTRGPQLDPDAVPLGQPADDEEAHPPGDGGVHRGRVAEPLVDLGEVLLGEADALVVDLDHDPGVRQPGGGDTDPGVG